MDLLNTKSDSFCLSALNCTDGYQVNSYYGKRYAARRQNMKVRQKSSAYFNNLLRPDWFVGFFIVTMCIFLIGGELTVALAQEGPDLVQESNIVEDAGVGIFSVLLTLPYGPTKIAYATLGGVVGVGAWLVSGGNVDVANTCLLYTSDAADE